MSPRFSVLTTVFDPEPEHLQACLDSVAGQTGVGEVQHVVVDDCSRNQGVRDLLERLPPTTDRVVVRRPVNGGIVAAADDALDRATGDFVVLLDHDDVLVPEALSTVAQALDLDPSIDVVYSDHDLLRPDGRCTSPVYKPDFSLERLRNTNYITHLVVVRRSVVVDLGGFRTGTDGAQDHDLLLRLAEAVGTFHHIPEILIHWRQSPQSVSTDVGKKPEAFDAAVRVVADHLERSEIAARTEPGSYAGLIRIRRAVSDVPTVTVVIPASGQRGRIWGVERIFVHDAVASLLADGDDRIQFEIVVIVDSETDPVVERGLRRIAGDALRIVQDDRPSEFSERVNLGVSVTSGEYVLLLGDHTQLIEQGSVAEMVGLAQQDEVGMVGAKLIAEDGTLQHGGYVLHGGISPALRGWPGDHPGPHRMLAVERECAGVSTAAALLRRDVFRDIGGMRVAVPEVCSDIDLSLTLRASGYRIVWTPHASWFCFDRPAPGDAVSADEMVTIRRRWGPLLETDPYSNPNLAPGRNDWLELPLRSGAPPYERLADGRISWG